MRSTAESTGSHLLDATHTNDAKSLMGRESASLTTSEEKVSISAQPMPEAQKNQAESATCMAPSTTSNKIPTAKARNVQTSKLHSEKSNCETLEGLSSNEEHATKQAESSAPKDFSNTEWPSQDSLHGNPKDPGSPQELIVGHSAYDGQGSTVKQGEPTGESLGEISAQPKMTCSNPAERPDNDDGGSNGSSYSNDADYSDNVESSEEDFEHPVGTFAVKLGPWENMD